MAAHRCRPLAVVLSPSGRKDQRGRKDQAMTDVRAPYYVSFVSEKVPTTRGFAVILVRPAQSALPVDGPGDDCE